MMAPNICQKNLNIPFNPDFIKRKKTDIHFAILILVKMNKHKSLHQFGELFLSKHIARFNKRKCQNSQESSKTLLLQFKIQ